MPWGISYLSGKDAVPVSTANPLPVSTVNPLPVSITSSGAGPTQITKAVVTGTNKSGTIATGGTAQTAIAANANRKGWMLGNVSATMTVTDDGSTPSATNGTVVNPGQSVDDGGNVTGQAIQVWCATTSATFFAVEYS